jgi:Domain of unknown function (DUF222)
MAAAEDLFDALAQLEAELSSADEEALAVGMVQLARFRTTCDALWLTLVAEVERRGTHRRQGARDVASWVASVAGERRGSARREVELAAHLSAAPLVAEAMAAGQISTAKAAELVRAAGLPEKVQSALLEDAASAPVEQVAASVERARLAHGTPATPPVRELTISRSADHAKVEGRLDLVDAEIVDVALSTMVEALDLPNEMPYAQPRARALVGLASHYLERQDQVTGRLGRPHVLVLVDLEVLEARSGGSAALASGAVISGDQARRLAEDANISRVVTKGRSEPLDVGRSTRSVPPAIAKAVITRDRHCRYRGCAAPPWACDIHHRETWARGGPTALHNVGLLCWYHHEHVHRRGPQHLRETPDGRWTLEVCSDVHTDAA